MGNENSALIALAIRSDGDFTTREAGHRTRPQNGRGVQDELKTLLCVVAYLFTKAQMACFVCGSLVFVCVSVVLCCIVCLFSSET